MQTPFAPGAPDHPAVRCGRFADQPAQVLDTVETDQGPVILYKNFSWEYLGDEPVMINMEDDSSGLFTNGWNTEQIFGFTHMSPDSIRDTVLFLTDAEHSFSMPATENSCGDSCTRIRDSTSG